ncbi:hypothetical protein HHI36_008921 [Cryptolaemus montrouzieri]|uniref:CCHC-type domain-containing protein n=1 Tax=Cryptolaemus montrouzieri TaxID=559131 RepID=A0ABD2MTY0_9CUCU
MKASIKDDAHSHRRQVFIKEDDIKKLPDVVTIECDGSINSIFFSTDNVMKCFKCGSVGHIAIDYSEPTQEPCATYISEKNAESTNMNTFLHPGKLNDNK